MGGFESLGLATDKAFLKMFYEKLEDKSILVCVNVEITVLCTNIVL